jgi:hypothetical protein
VEGPLLTNVGTAASDANPHLLAGNCFQNSRKTKRRDSASAT